MMSSILRPVLVMLGLLVVWEVGVRALGIRPFYLPAASVVLADLWSAPQLYFDAIVRTLTETLLGFVAGSLFGLAFGILFAHVRVAERMLFPYFVVSQTIPVIAFGALVIMWFGNGILSKAIIAFYLTFFPVTVNTQRGLVGVDEQRVALLRSFGAGSLKTFVKLRFPYALPSIMVALRLGISLSLVGAIVGEWFGDVTGLGVILVQAMFNEQMARLWAVILICGLLGGGLYGLMTALERRYVFWRSEV
jgi:NitT/TauT family transport system permease protein